ncbi:MAG TPA: DNA polymerase III subunit beta, partial [Pseudonocardiaceae bacterium]|nr:DNA polymerase III subunit beta [Pseudonocardiaceae bacterium]
ANGADLGEADESVKATVTGGLTQTFRVRYLVDTLRVFAGGQVRLAIRSGLRATRLTAVEPDPTGLALTYVVMPILSN